MGAFKDLTGMRFGSLVVVERAENNICQSGQRQTQWRCICDCGKEICVKSQALSNGSATACKECRKKSKDLSGQRFGRLVVINECYIDTGKERKLKWHCICDCGNETYVTRHSLVSGETKSCGCYNIDALKKRALDLSNKVFGRLTVLYQTDKRIDGKVVWHCMCECGNEIDVQSYSLTSGNTKSCGCFRREKLKELYTTHGGTGKDGIEKLYWIWYSMKMRCNNPNNSHYKNYGARGITVCKEWEHDYAAFRKWSYDNGYDENLGRKYCSIDRIDNDKGYSPDNCRWTDSFTQANNTSTVRHFKFNEEEHTLSEWAKILNMPYHTLKDRIQKKWSVERAFTQPIRSVNV